MFQKPQGLKEKTEEESVLQRYIQKYQTESPSLLEERIYCNLVLQTFRACLVG
jgi:hypothetical protein